MGRQVLGKLIGSITWCRSSSTSTSSYCQKSLCRQYVAAPPPPPAVFVDKNTRVICQGITGWKGTTYTKQAIEDGTKLAQNKLRGFENIWWALGSVTRQKGRTEHLGLPVFNSVAEAKAETKANASVIYVSPPFAAAAIMEAVEAELDLVFCITERIPQQDMVRVKAALNMQSKTRLIGPNFVGIIKPEECAIGVLPVFLHRPGCVGIVSRSEILTCEAAFQTTAAGLGQSISVGIGRGPFNGTFFVDCIEKLLVDPQTKGIILIGERGGTAEEDAAALIKKSGTEKPIVGFIAPRGRDPSMFYARGERPIIGFFAPRPVCHASPVCHARGGKGVVYDKIKALREAGVTVVESLKEIGVSMLDLFKQRGLVNYIDE